MKIQTFEDYQDLAMRTNATGEKQVKEIINRLTSEQGRNLIHAALGLSSEINEVVNATDNVNFIEELGDVFWYAALAASALNYKPRAYSLFGISTVNELIDSISMFADGVKKAVFYNKKYNETGCYESLDQIYTYLVNLCGSTNEVWLKNINKLKTRFPDAFSFENANNRNLESERKQLEN